VPYQHFTNSIENYFSMLKSRLQKTEGLKYTDLKTNIGNVLRTIPEKNYENIFKGAYERPDKYVAKNKTRKKPIYKIGVLNVKRCKRFCYASSKSLHTGQSHPLLNRR
jgi:hypothetical protein